MAAALALCCGAAVLLTARSWRAALRVLLDLLVAAGPAPARRGKQLEGAGGRDGHPAAPAPLGRAGRRPARPDADYRRRAAGKAITAYRERQDAKRT
ncbi:hypothetical protein [Micromonospora sp. NPDC050200]|uniref:hypothetical protein n=1 Tax=Micromonospora sp. NPDC050200 TaxID=3155664 RepID=UPI0033CF39B1